MMVGMVLLAAAVLLAGLVLDPVLAAPTSDHEIKTCAEWAEALETILGKEDHETDHEMDYVIKHEMIPKCDAHGNYVPKQCHVFTKDDEWCQPSGECLHFKEGERWCACVDPIIGMPHLDTLTHGGDDLHCDGNEEHFYPLCPPKWTPFESHGHDMCYRYMSSPKTFVEAESYCEFEGGHLASIHCEECNRFISTLTRGNSHEFPMAWVGGSNAVQECFWFWMDGRPFDFEDWYKNDIKNQKDSCLVVNIGLKLHWGATRCNHTLPFVCAKEAEVILPHF